ncbi:uncharacterized protein LOC122932797 [Bufo gargarizans]|uniref:uncharacterized protein LOC122932797 n=1 Tax=Bufo gargarizans TaxID=30331 RepID=UPI001CF17E98|nr:uncharacterized protein LOC122932797 [Bufo gargarizans]
MLALNEPSESSTIVEELINEETQVSSKFKDASTQTNYTFSNCVIAFKEEYECTTVSNPNFTNRVFGLPITSSTPHSIINSTRKYHTEEVASPLRKRRNLEKEFFPNEIDPVTEDLEILLQETQEKTIEDDLMNLSINVTEEELDNSKKDETYIPHDQSLTSNDNETLNSFNTFSNIQKQQTPLVNFTEEKDLVLENKLLVFESCLDNLLYKVKCQFDVDCPFLIKSFKKNIEGTYMSVNATCGIGHKFKVFENQPKIKNYGAGNLLLAAAILFSGLNFHKVKELFNIFGLLSFSEKSFYRYQSKFLFPAIDLAWQLDKKSTKEDILHKDLCIAGDGQCDSPGHNAKYCVYTMMDTVTMKILDFEVVQRTQCSSSVAMEKHGFGIVLDRILNEKYNIKIFASDRHVGIRKKMRQEYSNIKHQFDVWHYAKSLKKKLTSASRLKLCKEITPWIPKIIRHFWWSIQTCDDNNDLLKEKWLSLLQHLIDQHQWDGELYSECSHGEIVVENDDNIFWLQKDKPPYLHIQKIVNSRQLENDLQHLVHNCHNRGFREFP